MIDLDKNNIKTKTFRNEVVLCLKLISKLFIKLQDLFVLLQFSKRLSLSPFDILNLSRPPEFLPGHQHDSSEFLGYLLDTLHEQETNFTNTASSSEDEDAKADIPSLVQQSFGGQTLTVSLCGECQTKNERVDNFRELQLSFPNHSDNQTVQTLLDYYLQTEKLISDNQYHCERITRVVEAPPRLILTLKYFRYDPTSQQRTKLLQSVKLAELLALNNCRYELYAAVVHCGSSVDSGHYYTFAKDKTDWFKFNDCSVSRTTPDELSCLKPPDTAYILFYCREDVSESGDLPHTVLPHRMQLALSEDLAEFEHDKKQQESLKLLGSRQKKNDEPPPLGCGGGGFSSNSGYMFEC